MQASSRGKTHISAVHADDIADFLEGLGLAASFDDGTLRCSVCDQALLEAGIGAARAYDGQIVFACGNVDCIGELS
jgi:hypothetical protein